MKKWIGLFAVILAVAVAAPASAQDNIMKIYGAINYVSPLSDEDITIDTVTDSVEASDEVGYSLGFEWRLGKWAGIEFDYLSAKHDIEFAGQVLDDTTMSPLSGSFNFHLVHTRFLDFYFGPTLSWVQWDDVNIEGEKVKFDDEFAYGAQVGLDISLIKSLAIVTGLRYMKLDLTDEESGDAIGVDPLFAKVGLAFRW